MFYMTLILMWVSVILLPLVLRRLRPTAESIVLAWGCFTSWLRPPYLYLVLNVVIVTLGVKSGVLTSSGEAKIVESQYSSHSPPEDDLGCSDELENGEENQCFSSHLVDVEAEQEELNCLLEVVNGDDNYGEREEEEEEEQEDEDEEEDETELSAEELYKKAEVFIGNFYRELKLQRREDSWRKIHGGTCTEIR